MKSIIVNGKPMQVENDATLAQIAKSIPQGPYPILVAKIDNRLVELYRTPEDGASIELLDLSDGYAFRVYQRSLVFVMLYSIRQILGQDTRVLVKHSINRNYYCEIPKEGFTLTEEVLQKVKEKMEQTIAKDSPIKKHTFRLEEAKKIAALMNLPDKVRLMSFRTGSSVNLYEIDGYYDYFYGFMATSTGLLSKFDLTVFKEGFMLVFPDQRQPNRFGERSDVSKLINIFRESSKWAEILEVDSVGALNSRICKFEAGDVIRVSEALHEKKIAAMADQIHSLKRRVVLVAGPSSSGKTTFSHRLCVQLQVNGLRPFVISLDDYYVNRDKTPMDKDGKPDFESIKAIDTDQVNIDIKRLLSGETVDMPKYNFLTGRREYKGKFLKLEADDVLVIEGIHGLNPNLLTDVEESLKYKIFISALTQLNLDDHNRIPASDARMIRRMVRDNQFRGFDAKRTIELWPSVIRGEHENIFPFQEEADVIFNSALVYELCILKIYAIPQLFAINKDDPAYIEATRLLKFMDCFMDIPEKEVPNNSLLREFIGGGCFKVHG
jgi:uridine kinase